MRPWSIFSFVTRKIAGRSSSQEDLTELDPLFGRPLWIIREMPTIDHTIAFLKYAHAGQTDKAGREYYHHPVAVMNRLPEGADREVRLAALLHDILEDTRYTRADLCAMGYSDRTLDIVELVTGKPQDTRSYEQKIEALISSGNKDAILLKFADMSENTDPKRLAALPPDVRKYLENKYAKPKQALAKALGLG